MAEMPTIPAATPEEVRWHNEHFNAELAEFRHIYYFMDGEWKRYPGMIHASMMEEGVAVVTNYGQYLVRIFDALTGQCLYQEYEVEEEDGGAQ